LSIVAQPDLGYLPSTAGKVLLGLQGVNSQDTSAETKPDLQLEIAHLLLIDVVGYSKLLVNEQIELLQDLNQIVRNTECFRAKPASLRYTFHSILMMVLVSAS
jgi:hypothetical protein